MGGSDLAVSSAHAGLIDEFRFMINPVFIGEGTMMFHGTKGRLNLELAKTRKFGSGNVLLYYHPRRKVGSAN